MLCYFIKQASNKFLRLKQVNILNFRLPNCNLRYQ